MHQIKNLLIESTFPDQEKAKKFQHDVGTYLEESWQKSLSLWLDEVCPSDRYIKIDRLDIEVNFQYDDFQPEKWNELIVKLLKEKIQEELALSSYDINENLSIISEEQSWLDLWVIFWETGNLPWSAVLEDFDQLISATTIQKNKTEITQQRDKLSRLMLKSHFFARVHQSMDFQAFQMYMKLVQPKQEGLLEAMWVARQIYISETQSNRRDTGLFLSDFWHWLVQREGTSVHSTEIEASSLYFIYQYLNRESYDSNHLKASISVDENTFVSLLNKIIDSKKVSLPLSWRNTITRLIESADQIKSEELKESVVSETTDRIQDASIPDGREKAEGSTKRSEEETYEWQVEDAGVVLLFPFIQMLFQELGIYTKESNDINQRDLAVQILHYLVYGTGQFHPHRLTTIKCLIGLESNYVLQEVKLEKSIKKECDQLLESVIKHWAALKKTSPEGLRVSFLQRHGLLYIREDRFDLRIERKAYDILLDKLPWNYTVVKLPWMRKPMYVEW